MRRFNPTSPWPERAVQAWQILVCAASSRKTLTYEELSRIMYGKNAAGVISQVLAHVAHYCLDEDLPILTVIVVNKEWGVPGPEIPIASENLDAERERVYSHDWFDIYPPTPEELAAAFKLHQAQ